MNLGVVFNGERERKVRVVAVTVGGDVVRWDISGGYDIGGRGWGEEPMVMMLVMAMVVVMVRVMMALLRVVVMIVMVEV